MSLENVAVPRIVLSVMQIMDAVQSARALITLYLTGNVINVILIASLAKIVPRSVHLAARISR